MSGSNSSDPGAALPARTPEPVGLTVHGVELPEVAPRRRLSGRLQALLVVLACAAPVIASYFTYYVIRPEGRSNYSTLIEPARALPARLALRTLDGQAVAPATLRGQWLLVAVGPAACESACEARLFMQRQLREMLGRERDRLDKVWLVTDEAPVRPPLRAALEEAGVQILRVPAADLATWLEPAAGQPLDAHLYIVDPMGKWMMRPPADAQPARLKRDLDRLLRASSSWDTPGR
ncbi:MAG: SCO family protein [Rubrivivax sp.]